MVLPATTPLKITINNRPVVTTTQNSQSSTNVSSGVTTALPITVGVPNIQAGVGEALFPIVTVAQQTPDGGSYIPTHTGTILIG